MFSFSMFPSATTIDLYLAASLIGFATGTAISTLLLILTVRAAKLPSSNAASILFATCCLMWNLSGLAHSVALTCGAPEQGRAALIILACQYTAAAAWPFTVISLWSPLATMHWQKFGCRSLQALAVITGVLIVVPLWLDVSTVAVSSMLALKKLTPYNGALLLTLAIALFRDRLASRAMKLSVLAMLVGSFGAMSGVLITQLMLYGPVGGGLLRAMSEQITLLIVLGAFFLFSRFRFSDLFIRRSLRVLLAAIAAVAFTLSYYTLASFRLEGHVTFPATARASVQTLMVIPLMVLFTVIDRRIGEFVNRWIFRAPDYRALVRELSEKLAHLRSETEIASVVETAAVQSLNLRAAQLMPLVNLSNSSLLTSSWQQARGPEPDWLNAVSDGELVELACDGQFLGRHTRNDVELLSSGSIGGPGHPHPRHLARVGAARPGNRRGKLSA